MRRSLINPARCLGVKRGAAERRLISVIPARCEQHFPTRSGDRMQPPLLRSRRAAGVMLGARSTRDTTLLQR